MKSRYLISILIVFLSLGNSAFGQIVGGSVFMQGRWLECGVAPSGAWGNNAAAPAGYHTRCGSSVTYPGTPGGTDGLDFSYDAGHDGWTVGVVPWYGAYFLPGTPFDGWSIQVNGHRSDAYYTDGGFYNADPTNSNLTGSITGYQQIPASCMPMPSRAIGTWTGTAGPAGSLHITQSNRLDTDASWVVVTTKFINTSADTMHDLYYFVSGDPDNDEALNCVPGQSGSFPTDNHISYQGDAENRHEVNARPPSIHRDAFSGLATKDCRAKAMIYNGWPPSTGVGNELDLVWAGVPTGGMAPCYYSLYATTFSQDIAYGLIYNLGNLPPGDSTVLSFAWIFSDTLAIDSAFPGPKMATEGVMHDTWDSVFACSMSGCGVAGLTFKADIVGGDDKDWSFSKWTWSPATGLSSSTGAHVTVDVTALSGPTVFTVTGTKDVAHGQCGTKTLYLYVEPCFHATNNGPICMNDTLKLVAHGDSTGATYFWWGPAGYTAFTQNAFRTGLSWADTGWYTVVRTVGGFHDTAKTHVMLKPLPAVTLGSTGPICSGPPNTLLLTATLFDVGETFAWTGPNVFSSTLQNPSRPSPPVMDGGLYKVVTTLNGCMDSGTIVVIIDTTPAKPTATSTTPICSGHRDTLKLFSTCATPGVSYSWSGPPAFTSFLQNPIIPSPHVPNSGTFTVTVSLTADGITCSNSNTTVVVIDSTPFMPTLGSNAPICSGNPLLLTATSTDLSTYDWYGPNGFVSGLQNPTISPASTFAAGIYHASATLGACTSDTATLIVVVDSTPETPVASSNSPGPPSICERDTLKLTSFSNTAGVGYTWVGPNSFTSTEQNPIIVGVTPAATGSYTVTVSLGACSSAAVITVTITPTPLLVATSNSPVCTGETDTLFLQATSNPGATFTWTGPYTFTSNAQNPSRTPVVKEFEGIYKVVSFLNGCTSLPVDDTVYIRQTPPPPWVKWMTYCQGLDVPPLQATGDSILWYPTATGVGTLVAPVPPTAKDTVMWFYLTQTVQSCMSAMDSMKVTVNPKPVITVSPSIDVCPHDSVILATANPDAIAYYHWTPAIYLNDTTGPSVISKPETNVNYRVVASNKYDCTDTGYIAVKVRQGAILWVGDSLTLYPGESYQIEPQTNCSSFAWFPPAGLSNAYVSNPLATPEISTKYIVHGITSWGCKATDSIDIFVNPESLLALPNAFTPGTGPNGEFRIIMRGIASLNYFRIWDRWGVKVFETTDMSKGWDGKLNGTPQPFGVFIYEVSATTSTGRQFVKHGNVTLIR
jgi:gliding motility-associated-like protein